MNDEANRERLEVRQGEDASEELYALCSALCEGPLTPADGDRLAALLGSGASARRFYLRYLAVHETLRSNAGCAGVDADYNARMSVERLAVERFAGAVSPAASVLQKSKSHLRMPWLTSAAAVFVVAVGLAYFSNPSVGPKLDARSSIATAPKEMQSSPLERKAGPIVAQVTQATGTIAWRNPNASYAVTSRVRAGEALAFHEGKLEITYASGTKLILTGPAEFEVQPEGGRLRLGELVAHVPVEGHGFTVETPQGKVVDLGTEFGVVVDDFGISQISVFEGKVETTPRGGPGKPPRTIELTSGKAVQWDGTAFVPTRFHDRRFGIEAETPRVGSLEGIDEPLTKLTSNDLDPSLWRRLGDVEATRDGASLHGESSGPLPHILTVGQFDPTEGEVTIECDLRFAGDSNSTVGTLTLLTRAADDQSVTGKAWESMLAHAVRCRLHADLKTGDVRLEAGTKQEFDREPSTISWGGFTQQSLDARYHLVMRDDGLNVTFTVSLADNPTISKTITCRSLFRGYENFVAIEGPANCTAILDHLVVSQRTPQSRNEKHLSSVFRVDDVSPIRSAREVLDELAPENATLLLKEDFSAYELDHTRWSTLGEVAVVDGRVQLGKENKTNHIDTWRARPYLITSKPIDFGQHPIAVVGVVEFAENFLHGYGGSFAVMTRADKERGHGPGWENSILQRGVRSNLWPAAFGFGHSLELHEKPQRNTISLLAAKSFPVPPKGRHYAFSVFDDGAALEATFIDLSDPEARATITHSITQFARGLGHIGFESCWGSPVSIDEVRVYGVRSSD